MPAGNRIPADIRISVSARIRMGRGPGGRISVSVSVRLSGFSHPAEGFSSYAYGDSISICRKVRDRAWTRKDVRSWQRVDSLVVLLKALWLLVVRLLLIMVVLWLVVVPWRW